MEDGAGDTKFAGNGVIVVVVEENGSTMTVQLPDGSHAIVHNSISTHQEDEEEEEGVKLDSVGLQLEDGGMEYLPNHPIEHILLQSEAGISDSAHMEITLSSSPTSSSSHTLSSQTGSCKLMCTYSNCGKFFSSSNHLKAHERIHAGLRPHVCETCQKCFLTTYALKAHIRTHTGEKPYCCPQENCRKCFKTSGDLHKHIRTHTGERPFKCEACDKSFTTSNIRKVHMRVHTGERPYECRHQGCGRRFASATNYKNHCRIHTGERPYICSVEKCGKRFTEYSSLYKHHMVHNNQKQYICSLCGRHYRQLSTLTLHKKTVHNVNMPVDFIEHEKQLLILEPGMKIEVVDEQISLAESNVIGTPITVYRSKPSLSNTVIETSSSHTTVKVATGPACIRRPSIVAEEEGSLLDAQHMTLKQDDNGELRMTCIEGHIDEESLMETDVLVLADPIETATLQQSHSRSVYSKSKNKFAFYGCSAIKKEIKEEIFSEESLNYTSQ